LYYVSMHRNRHSSGQIDLNDLASAFCQITDVDRMKQFFHEIFTDNERIDLSLRWRLMELLKTGMAQRRIAAELGISLCKITRGARIIKNRRSVTNQILDSRTAE